MSAQLKPAPATAATVGNGNGPCKCAKGQVVILRAFALQKSRLDNSKKAYAYVLEVRRSDGSEYQIHKSHCDLVCLANSLPRLRELALEKKLKKTEFPKLPDRVERTKDLSKITKYFASLLQLQDDNNIVSKALSGFCQQDSSCDICYSEDAVGIVSSGKKSNLKKAGAQSILNISSPMALPSYRVTLNYKSEDKRQISLQMNTIVQIYKKCPSGWWYVVSRDNSGWFPASYLEMVDTADADEITPLETPERYKTTCDYTAQNVDELSFNANAIVNVKLKKMDGWWIAECLGKEGYVPATYLRPCDMTASDCNGMCWETMDMKLTARRCSSEDQKISENGGIDLMPGEEIIREEKHKPDSNENLTRNSIVHTSNRSSSSSSSSSSSNRSQQETYSPATLEADSKDESTTQL